MGDFLKDIDEKYDYLTQLYERTVIEDITKLLMQDGTPFSLILIDVDNFKNINDGYGHAVGDKVITFAAQQLKKAFGEDGIVGRFGGDEFIAVVPNIVEYDAVWHLCRRLFTSIDGFSMPGFPVIYITMTIGLSRFPQDSTAYEDLFEMADKALYRGKTKGRSCFIIYLEEKHKNIKLLSSNDTTMSSMQMSHQIFMYLTQSEDLTQTIPLLIKFFSISLMIDHIALQGETKLLFSELYPLAKVVSPAFVDNALIEPNVSNSTGIFYKNEIDRTNTALSKELREQMMQQNINSCYYAKISFGDKIYGYLRADSAIHRIWQNKDMTMLLTAAKAIGMSLHYQNKTLDELAD